MDHAFHADFIRDKPKDKSRAHGFPDWDHTNSRGCPRTWDGHSRCREHTRSFPVLCIMHPACTSRWRFGVPPMRVGSLLIKWRTHTGATATKKSLKPEREFSASAYSCAPPGPAQEQQEFFYQVSASLPMSGHGSQTVTEPTWAIALCPIG
jgi:hypothetical protein